MPSFSGCRTRDVKSSPEHGDKSSPRLCSSSALLYFPIRRNRLLNTFALMSLRMQTLMHGMSLMLELEGTTFLASVSLKIICHILMRVCFIVYPTLSGIKSVVTWQRSGVKRD